MNILKINRTVLIISFLLTMLSSKSQELHNTLPNIENRLVGELDYTKEVLELFQKQANGKEISLGKINTDGTIHFNLPEYDIKALYDSIPLQHYKFQQLFKINSECKDIDVFAKTPFDDVYSEKYKLLVKKYGIDVAILEPVTNEEKVSNNETNSSIYYWFYIDRAIAYKEECSKTNSSTGDIYANISVDIQFEKGWNFIEENSVTAQNNSESNSNTIKPQKIQFTKVSPANKKIKWTLRQFVDDEKIQAAKKLHHLTPITQEQFEKWVPNKLGNLLLTNKEYGIPPIGRKNKNNIHLTYASETQKREIDLYVVDYSKNPEAIEMIDFAYAMENDGKDEKDIKPYIAQYSEREKVTKLLYKVGDRMFVEASATNMNGEELWGYIEKLNVEKLLKN